jgi:hypothetical protein
MNKALQPKVLSQYLGSQILTGVVGGLISVISLCTTAQAQPVSADEFNDRVNEAVNGVTIFTTQDSASSGVFSLKSDTPGQSDRDIDILKLPGKHTFGEEGDVLRPQIRGVVGSFRSSFSPRSPVPGEMDDFSRMRAVTGAVAAGVVYKPWQELRVTPLMSVGYTHLKRWYDYNNSFSQTNFLPYDREAFNTSANVMTYSPTVEVDYTFKVDRATLIPKLRYAHLFNDSVSSKSSVIDVSSNSGLLQSFFDVRAPIGYRFYQYELGVHPYIVRTDVYGSARAARGPNYFYELGADLTFEEEPKGLINGFYVGASYLWGDDLSGYRLGAGLRF